MVFGRLLVLIRRCSFRYSIPSDAGVSHDAGLRIVARSHSMHHTAIVLEHHVSFRPGVMEYAGRLASELNQNIAYL